MDEHQALWMVAVDASTARTLFGWHVHGMCRSGHHAVCQGYEEWNLKAMHVCMCLQCNHPKPVIDGLKELLASLLTGQLQSRNRRSRMWRSKQQVEEVGPAPANVKHETKDTDMTDETVTAAPEEEVTEDTASDEADATTEDEGDDDDDGGSTQRRERGALEADVKSITDDFVTGAFKTEDDNPLTPHRIAKAIAERDGLDKPPSTGAVAAVLDRWDNYGFADIGEGPVRFVDYTEAGRTEGLTALKAKHREKLRAERAAEKEAEEDDAEDAA